MSGAAMEAQPSEGGGTGAAPAEGSPEKPRLMISKIVCTNFKSYAGVRELGPFHKCFTSIVGPNGSGKSNVIDAMLFVFGYRARKIRSKKISVLIHSSDQHKNLESCTVAVHFQLIIDLEDDDFSVVPRSQFVVSRTAHKDGSSYYSQNDHRKPFKEIASLLRESGIDLDHNRFLILQGEVEQIALMKPKAQTEHDEGMLEFLEDIIGTSKLKEPIEEMGKKLEELNEARGEKLNRVKVVEKEKTGLETAKNEAEEYLGMQRQAAGKQHSLYQRYIHECGGHELKAREKKEELEAQAKEYETVLATLSADKKEKMKAQKKDCKAYERLVKGNDLCKEGMASCEQRDVRARQDVKNVRASQKKVAKNLEKERTKLEELKAAPDKHRSNITKMEAKLATLEARKSEEEQKLAEVMESLKTATMGLQSEKEEHETQLIELKRTVNEAKSKLDVAQAELDIYREKHTRQERQLQETREQLQTVRASLKESKSTHASLEKSLPGKKQRLSKSQTEMKTLTERCDALRRDMGEIRGTVEDAKSSMQANRSRGQVLKALMDQRDSGALPGIHGRLGDLGAIDEKYDVAISTACGALDHIIVDSMDTAVKCVEFLKKRNVGLATFIGLDKIEHLRKNATSKISTPESVPRLFDLVRPKDPLFLSAFYFALRNTLVASDLDQATRIGLQGRTRHRVVTLGGQLIDTSGTMSGGGGKVMKGRMSSRIHDDVSPLRLTEMETSLAQKEKTFQECKKHRDDLEEVVKQLQTEISAEESQLKKTGRAVEVMRTSLKALEERVRELEREKKEAGSTMDTAHLKKLETQVQGFERDHRKAADAAGIVEAEVKRLHDQIMDVGGARLKPQQAMVDKISNEIDEANGTITKAKVGIKTNERDTKKCSDKIASLQNDLEASHSKLEDLNEVLTQLEEEATAIVARQKEIETELKEHEEALKKVKGQIERIEDEETREQAKLMDVRHELEKYVMKMKENQQKIRHFRNEMKKLDIGLEEAPVLSEEELHALDKKAVEYEITMLEERLKQMTPNMAAIEEYKRKEELHNERLAELDAITAERDEGRMRFEELRKQRLDQFMTGFSTITYKLKEMYQMITLGGDAELELVDSLDPFSEGIVFSVRPPKKSWKNISNLSGGEKTLSSLALVFALHHYKPSPLYVMDEIDAALDFRNVSIVAHYIKERTKNAQFIIISLRNNMFELADRLVGIYKTDNCTKSVTINPKKLKIGGLPSTQTEPAPMAQS